MITYISFFEIVQLGPDGIETWSKNQATTRIQQGSVTIEDKVDYVILHYEAGPKKQHVRVYPSNIRQITFTDDEPAVVVAVVKK